MTTDLWRKNETKFYCFLEIGLKLRFFGCCCCCLCFWWMRITQPSPRERVSELWWPTKVFFFFFSSFHVFGMRPDHFYDCAAWWGRRGPLLSRARPSVRPSVVSIFFFFFEEEEDDEIIYFLKQKKKNEEMKSLLGSSWILSWSFFFRISKPMVITSKVIKQLRWPEVEGGRIGAFYGVSCIV